MSEILRAIKLPNQVIHTGVSQIRLANKQWAYILVMIDEASKAVLAFQVSDSSNRLLIISTPKQLEEHLSDTKSPLSILIKDGTTSCHILRPTT